MVYCLHIHVDPSEGKDPKISEFRDIFWQSGATVNPDTLAYFYFEQFSGNIPFKNVR